MRIVFFGTPGFAVPTLDALLASTHSLVAVVTQPDRPRGRGQKVIDSPVKARAAEAGVPVLQPDSLKGDQFVGTLAAFRPDLGVVAAYGKILTEAVLAVPRHGMVNVHASLLPKYRGAAPVHRAVMAGEPTTGVTIMRVVKALDAGPMLGHAARPIGTDETSEDVEADLARIGAALLSSLLDALAAGRQTEQPQDETLATYAARLTKADGIVDWRRPALDIHNQIRGLHPWPHAYAYVRGERLILHRSQCLDEESSAPPGTIVAAQGDDLRIACGHGTLRLVTLQAEGSRPLSARAFLSGHALPCGDRLTPAP